MSADDGVLYRNTFEKVFRKEYFWIFFLLTFLVTFWPLLDFRRFFVGKVMTSSFRFYSSVLVALSKSGSSKMRTYQNVEVFSKVTQKAMTVSFQKAHCTINIRYGRLYYVILYLQYFCHVLEGM